MCDHCCGNNIFAAPGRAALVPLDSRKALKSCEPGATVHVKLVIDWDKETNDFLFISTKDEYPSDSESVYLQKEHHPQPQTCTLSQYFQVYIKEEQLVPDNA